MTLIADILLIAGALAATFYCMVLSRRLGQFNDLEKGVGGAVAILSVQVEDMTKTLLSTKLEAGKSAASLEELTLKADGAAKRLELLMASMHDLPEPRVKDEKPIKTPNAEMVFLRHQENGLEAAE